MPDATADWLPTVRNFIRSAVKVKPDVTAEEIGSWFVRVADRNQGYNSWGIFQEFENWCNAGRFSPELEAAETANTGDEQRRKEALRREVEEAEARHDAWTRISERHRDARGYDMLAIAADSELDAAGREQARGMVKRCGRYTTIGL